MQSYGMRRPVRVGCMCWSIVLCRKAVDDGSVAALLRETGSACSFFETDVTDSSQVQALIQKTLATFGKIDVCILHVQM